MDNKKQPIIIKKIVRGGHGHHGGSWKVAFADFATAMMAFFMLMWLMGGTSDSEKAAISEFFVNPSAAIGTSNTPTPTSSALQGPGGASTSMIQLGGAMDLSKGEGQKLNEKMPDDEKVIKKAEELEKKRLESLMEKLKEAIEESGALKPFKDQMKIEITPEGLRIQIVDKENRPMFSSGRADLKDYSSEILYELASFINEVPNHISITGHTDATPYAGKPDYSNWELSADRANAARRALILGGMGKNKIGRVVGLSSTLLFDKKNPLNPINRRISIIVMNKATEEAIEREEGTPIKEQGNPETEFSGSK
ncbi:MAG: hypothetical protein BMS9Abin36_0469 [Gammaproteobacteria bacterium]|nr:MAG: hypothetical protein BMS9Abin36_0469 [Gammaproteobacteria bacterium]